MRTANMVALALLMVGLSGCGPQYMERDATANVPPPSNPEPIGSSVPSVEAAQ